MPPLGIHVGTLQAYQCRPGQLADGTVYIIGPGGDDDPGFILTDPVLNNDSATTSYLVGATIVGTVGSGIRKTLIPAGFIVPLPGDFEQLVFYNTSGSGANVNPDVAATTNAAGNSSAADPHVVGQRLAPSSSTFERAFRMTVTANVAVTKTWTPKADITLASMRVWSKVPCTSAGGTYLLTGTATGGPRGTRTLFTAFNLEAITAATLTAVTMATDADLLKIDKGETVSLVATSNNADLVIGDVAFSAEFTIR